MNYLKKTIECFCLLYISVSYHLMIYRYTIAYNETQTLITSREATVHSVKY